MKTSLQTTNDVIEQVKYFVIQRTITRRTK